MKDQGGNSENKDRLEREVQFEQIREALEGLRYGQVTIVIHDGAVVQIDRTEKRRFRNSSNASTS
ncbi:MAG: YezD family protein [Pirellula sp.]